MGEFANVSAFEKRHIFKTTPSWASLPETDRHHARIRGKKYDLSDYAIKKLLVMDHSLTEIIP